jgi:hypothetical protein
MCYPVSTFSIAGVLGNIIGYWFWSIIYTNKEDSLVQKNT